MFESLCFWGEAEDKQVYTLCCPQVLWGKMWGRKCQIRPGRPPWVRIARFGVFGVRTRHRKLGRIGVTRSRCLGMEVWVLGIEKVVLESRVTPSRSRVVPGRSVHRAFHSSGREVWNLAM